MKRLASLFRRKAPAPSPGDAGSDPQPAPERLTFAIGDVHGCLGLLDDLLGQIAAEAGSAPHDIVFLGDYVDRGPDSAGVLDRLMSLHGARTPEAGVVCLAGNHDRMLLHYLAEPEDGVRWLWVGGRETLTSFGIAELRIAGGGGDPMADRVQAQAIALAHAMGEDMVSWLAELPLWWRSGNLVAVHALTDPALPMEAQSEETLLWKRPGRELFPRADGTWVVHGHTPGSEPTTLARHVNVDTGAFGGGPLTAAVFAPGEAPRFLKAPWR